MMEASQSSVVEIENFLASVPLLQVRPAGAIRSTVHHAMPYMPYSYGMLHAADAAEYQGKHPQACCQCNVTCAGTK